jgi:hypothetical protein
MKATEILAVCFGNPIEDVAKMYKVSTRTVYNHFNDIRLLTDQSQEGVNIAIPMESSWDGRINAYLTPNDDEIFFLNL